MSTVKTFRNSPLFKSVLLLLIFSAFCLAMQVLRMVSTGTTKYIFLNWNLFLAWIPLLVVVYMSIFWNENKQTENKQTRIQYILGLGIWLLFLPNAPYIITDLLHLRSNTEVPVWYDSLLVFSYAMAGLQAGLFSLYLAQKIITRLYNAQISQIAIAGFVFLSSYGVYLGRFQRWNSWDLFTKPHRLLIDSFSQLTNPTAIKVTVVLTCVLAFFYLIFLSLIQLKTHEPQTSNSLLEGNEHV